MKDELGLSDESLAECKQKRERAERAFEAALDELASRIELKPEHYELLGRTNMLLASETLPVIDKMLSEQDDDMYFDADSEKVVRADYLLILGKRLKGDFSFLFTNNDGYSIIVGERAEASDFKEYVGGLTAELAHMIVHSLDQFRDEDFTLNGSVSEFYDIAFSWQNKRTTPKQLTALMRLSDFHVRHGHDREYIKDVARRAPQVLSLLGQDAQSIDSKDVYRILRSSEYRNQEHVGGASIGWCLANEVSERVGCALRETLPHLTKVAEKAMYDEAVDFSSPDAFVETVTARLDDYLA